jgi:phospholipid transport system substrate-binding protein
LRALLARSFVCFALAIAPLAAAAGPAGDHIQPLADQAIRTLASTKGDLHAREARLRPLLAEGFDMAHIAQFAAGAYWNAASEEQRQEYSAAFSDYVLATYARRFGGYAGETLEIVSEREISAEETAVTTRINRGAAPPIDAEWRVRLADDAPKVIDIWIEGRSMAIVQRQEYAGIVRQHGFDGLVHVLQARANRLRAQ